MQSTDTAHRRGPAKVNKFLVDIVKFLLNVCRLCFVISWTNVWVLPAGRAFVCHAHALTNKTQAFTQEHIRKHTHTAAHTHTHTHTQTHILCFPLTHLESSHASHHQPCLQPPVCRAFVLGPRKRASTKNCSCHHLRHTYAANANIAMRMQTRVTDLLSSRSRCFPSPASKRPIKAVPSRTCAHKDTSHGKTCRERDGLQPIVPAHTRIINAQPGSQYCGRCGARG